MRAAGSLGLFVSGLNAACKCLIISSVCSLGRRLKYLEKVREKSYFDYED